MSGNMKKLAALFIILIVILLLPYILGQFIQYKFEEEVANLNQELFPLFKQSTPLKLDYQAGWFNSTATIKINDVVFNNQINHTPYTLLKLTKIKTTTQFPENIASTFHALFSDQLPYELITAIGFNGNTLLNITSPAVGEKTIYINNSDVLVNWQGLTLNAEFAKKSLAYELDLPKLLLSKPSKESLLIENLQANTTQITINKIAVALSPLTIQLNAIKASKNTIAEKNIYALTLKQFSLKNTTLLVSIKNIDNLFEQSENNTYQNTFNATPVLINNNNGEQIVQTNYYSEQILSTEQGLINYNGTHKLSDIMLKLPHYDNALQNATLSYQIERLPQKQVIDFLRTYIKFFVLSARHNIKNKSIEEQQNEVNQMAINLAIATLRETPKLTLHASVNDSKGIASLDFEALLKTPDISSISIRKIQQNLTYRLNISFSIKVAKTLLDSVVQSATMGDSKRNQLKQLLQKLPMIESEDQYQTNIIFKNNMFYVNGHYDPHFVQTYLPILKEYLL